MGTFQGGRSKVFVQTEDMQPAQTLIRLILSEQD
jgi:hypothetical protein